MQMTSGFDQQLAQVADRVNARLDPILSDQTSPGEKMRPPRLLAAMRYGVLNGGKRIRPFLLIQSASLFGVEEEVAIQTACALECLHCYSLIHDDLPCMDDDDMRRGKPTVHKAFDEPTAVLAGDSLHALAFEILASPDRLADPFIRIELTRALAVASGPDGMAGGQMMDLAAEHESFDLATVTRLQQMKTGALISVSVEMAAILAHLPDDHRASLRGYARDIGLAFQIADDLLDAEGDEEAAGKALRKDVEQGKETFLSLLGTERARAQAAMLVDQAIEHLGSYGKEADLLRDLARFIIDRDR